MNDAILQNKLKNMEHLFLPIRNPQVFKSLFDLFEKEVNKNNIEWHRIIPDNVLFIYLDEPISTLEQHIRYYTEIKTSSVDNDEVDSEDYLDEAHIFAKLVFYNSTTQDVDYYHVDISANCKTCFDDIERTTFEDDSFDWLMDEYSWYLRFNEPSNFLYIHPHMLDNTKYEDIHEVEYEVFEEFIKEYFQNDR